MDGQELKDGTLPGREETAEDQAGQQPTTSPTHCHWNETTHPGPTSNARLLCVKPVHFTSMGLCVQCLVPPLLSRLYSSNLSSSLNLTPFSIPRPDSLPFDPNELRLTKYMLLQPQPGQPHGEPRATHVRSALALTLKRLGESHAPRSLLDPGSSRDVDQKPGIFRSRDGIGTLISKGPGLYMKILASIAHGVLGRLKESIHHGSMSTHFIHALKRRRHGTPSLGKLIRGS
ncbi:hypothetical protein B0T10DRAFT_570268 [Thelonectria olida]|uniref:Uncharacterized protein n=1 Tax=Thelonectria olida TaxID=1576542 RepID=A0A9P9ATI5_9HYPO|nr:hypothetical protein B0T10DRAFT_570268 [Thelonectria olida]